MIVKDEADVIERCLASVEHLISYWVICDTGSTDGTQDLIRAHLEGVPGELHERPWVDFGTNRSELLALSRGKADYLLLLDADWTFTAQPGALDRLNADEYLVEHRHIRGAEFSLHNRHLVRGSRRWWYVGVTHEHIRTEGKPRSKPLRNAYITNWIDGGVGREQRWEQDARLLEAELERHPDSPRERFYLAQTYRDLGRTEAAIEQYALRAKLGGWAEEVFYSLFQVGALHRKLGDWDAAVPALLRALEFRPSRIEPLFPLTAGSREHQEYEQALRYAKQGINRKLPADVLFVEPWLYKWGMLLEYSVAAYYTGDVETARRINDQLLARTDIPDADRQRLIANRKFYVPAQASEADELTDQPATGFMLGNQRISVSLPGKKPPTQR